MHELELTQILSCALYGVIHSAVPCAHSWPMLIPFAAPGAHGFRAAVLFGAGMIATGIVVGFLLGFVFDLVSAQGFTRAEEVVGVILIGLGVLLVVYPKAVHSAHVHGGGGKVDDISCSHATHAPRRLLRFGPGIGLVLLGGFNLVLPCVTSAPAYALASAAALSGGVLASVALMGTFSFAAAITMGIILKLVTKSLSILNRLDSSRVNGAIIRVSGLLLIYLGLSLVFHWHEHHHHHH